MHLCLVLTDSYYKSETRKVYRFLVPSVAVIYGAYVVYCVVANGAIPF